MVKVQKQKKFQRNEQLYINMAKNNHGLNFQSFWKEMKSKKIMSIYIAKKVTQRAITTQNFL